MSILLVETLQPCLIKAGGEGNLVLTVGQRLSIETSPNGEELLNTEVPEGKVWSVYISVQINETDA